MGCFDIEDMGGHRKAVVSDKVSTLPHRNPQPYPHLSLPSTRTPNPETRNPNTRNPNPETLNFDTRN
jgi:hypothetical protein